MFHKRDAVIDAQESVDNVQMGRDPLVDIIKGLGIACIVAGHSSAPFTHFLYLFHVAVFFIASGFCYRSKKSESTGNLIQFIKRKVMTLYVPYVLLNCIFTILHNFFIRINVYTLEPSISEYVTGAFIGTTAWWSGMDICVNIIKGIFLVGGTQIGGALWFVATLFTIEVLYCFIDYLLKTHHCRFHLQSVVSALFLALGFGIQHTNMSGGGVLVGRILTCYALFHVGFCLKRFSQILGENNRCFVHLSILAGCAVTLIICNTVGSVELGQNEYKDPLFLLAASVSGWFLLYEFSWLINRVQIMKRLLVILGQNSFYVLVLHFLCFKVINWIGVVVNAEPYFLIAAFPVLYMGGLWWIAYVVAGTTIPVLCGILWKKCKASLKCLAKKVL